MFNRSEDDASVLLNIFLNCEGKIPLKPSR